MFWKLLLFPFFFVLMLVAVGSIAKNAPDLVFGMGIGGGGTVVYLIAKYRYCKAHNRPFKLRTANQLIMRVIDKLQHGPRKRAEYRRAFRHYVKGDWEDTIE
jgi:hypothetical protein